MVKLPLAPLWTSQTAGVATKPLTSRGAWSAWGVSIDTRTLKPGDLFVGLKGPRYDGNQFAAQALEAGAAAVCLDHRPDDLPDDAPLLMVQDTLKALYDLADYKRAHSNARIIAVTGSVGKTNTTQTLFHVLRHQHPSHATSKNLNNQYGSSPVSKPGCPRIVTLRFLSWE